MPYDHQPPRLPPSTPATGWQGQATPPRLPADPQATKPPSIHDKIRGTPTTDPLLILGETVYRNRHDRFGLLPEDRLRHLWIVGKTGSGKSTLLANLLAQDLARGAGVALLDPHGDLVETATALVPRHRTNDVLLFTPADESHPISFNVFRQGKRAHPDPALLTSQLVSVFKKQWSDSWGPRLEHVLRNAILAVAPDPRATLLFLYRFLTDESLRDKVVAKVTDPMVQEFWTREFAGYTRNLQAEATAPVLNKLGAFVANPKVRAIVSQERSRVDLVRLMNEQGILLANLATGTIGEDASLLLGGLLLTSIQLAVMERPRGGAPFFLYIDEFQNFVTDSLATMLAEARKFGLGLILAHQYLAQLPLSLRAAVLGNVGSTVLFRLGAADAQILEPDFNPHFTTHDLQHLPPYHSAVKLLARGKELSPFLARTLSEPVVGGSRERVERIRGEGRRKFCQAKSFLN